VLEHNALCYIILEAKYPNTDIRNFGEIFCQRARNYMFLLLKFKFHLI